MQSIYQPVHAYRAEFVMLRGIQHRLCRWGTPGGKPILLLHGWMDCAATFQFLVDLAPAELLGFDLIGLDWRGFGQSGWAEAGYYFPDYLADLDALLDIVARERPVTLFGHSMGGIVACLYAGIRPERIENVVSLEGFGLPATQAIQAPGRYRRWLDELRSPPESKLLASLGLVAQRLSKNNSALPPERAAWLASELAVATADAAQYRADPRHKWVNPVLYRLEEAMACWREVQAKVLWLAGDEPKLLKWLDETPEQFALRRACFSHLTYETLAGCGHNLHHDAPQAVAQRLVRFIG